MLSVERALQKLGIEYVEDFNDPNAPAACTGVCDVIKDAHCYRHSTYRAFLPPALTHARKAHLKICTNTLVTGIELVREGARLRATGVQFESSRKRDARYRYVAKARREIILCAGALGSPQLANFGSLGAGGAGASRKSSRRWMRR